jgi:hypothetical protein
MTTIITAPGTATDPEGKTSVPHSDDTSGAVPGTGSGNFNYQTLAPFIKSLIEFNPSFFEPVNRQAVEQVRQTVETGGADPAFGRFRQSQMDLINEQRRQQTQQTAEQLARQGVTGSSALNELNRIGRGFDVRESALTEQLGLQQLGRRDQAVNLLQQFEQLNRESELEGISTGLQNLLALPQIEIAKIAAQTAASSGGGGGGGGGGDSSNFGIFGEFFKGAGDLLGFNVQDTTQTPTGEPTGTTTPATAPAPVAPAPVAPTGPIAGGILDRPIGTTVNTNPIVSLGRL